MQMRCKRCGSACARIYYHTRSHGTLCGTCYELVLAEHPLTDTGQDCLLCGRRVYDFYDAVPTTEGIVCGHCLATREWEVGSAPVAPAEPVEAGSPAERPSFDCLIGILAPLVVAAVVLIAASAAHGAGPDDLGGAVRMGDPREGWAALATVAFFLVTYALARVTRPRRTERVEF